MSRFDGKKVKAVFGGKGFYIALALCLLAAGIVGYYTLLRPQAPAEPASNPASNVPDDRDNAWVAPAVQPEENVPAAPPAEETPISDPQDLLPQVMSPLDGTTVTVFSVTELMYDETMADWRTHNGIDIQASEGDSVRTAAGGTVLSVKDDELMGTTVVIQHGGGYTTQYSCLQKDPPVQEGDQVAAGDVIGLVGSTASAEDGNWYQITFSGTTGYVRADGCQTVQYSDYAGTSAVKSAREDLVDYAKSFLGTRYVWGGASPSGFDCSGFTMYVYAHFGYRMSHGASDQLYAFTRVSTAERLAGDLVFFSYGGGDISHVGIYLGGGAFIHATSNGGVKISYFDGYYSSTYVGAVRILAD